MAGLSLPGSPRRAWDRKWARVPDCQRELGAPRPGPSVSHVTGLPSEPWCSHLCNGLAPLTPDLCPGQRGRGEAVRENSEQRSRSPGLPPPAPAPARSRFSEGQVAETSFWVSGGRRAVCSPGAARGGLWGFPGADPNPACLRIRRVLRKTDGSGLHQSHGGKGPVSLSAPGAGRSPLSTGRQGEEPMWAPPHGPALPGCPGAGRGRCTFPGS